MQSLSIDNGEKEGSDREVGEDGSAMWCSSDRSSPDAIDSAFMTITRSFTRSSRSPVTVDWVSPKVDISLHLSYISSLLPPCQACFDDCRICCACDWGLGVSVQRLAGDSGWKQ